ncbi:hypothetical protein, partial [Pseudomonas sp. KCJK9000]|uniref:hypothetical protein n=1 Tax=Pseudomonas sp. KCJK9000 TaxID=3344566 RepID=UPI003905ABA1
MDAPKETPKLAMQANGADPFSHCSSRYKKTRRGGFTFQLSETVFNTFHPAFTDIAGSTDVAKEV